MNAFDRRGRSIQRGTAHAEHLAGGVDKEGRRRLPPNNAP